MTSFVFRNLFLYTNLFRSDRDSGHRSSAQAQARIRDDSVVGTRRLQHIESLKLDLLYLSTVALASRLKSNLERT